jgi:hypothetical protein
MFPATVVAQLERPLASFHAVVRSLLAVAAAELATFWVPLTVPGGKPETDVPGLSPRSPVRAVAPVLAIDALERTA